MLRIVAAVPTLLHSNAARDRAPRRLVVTLANSTEPQAETEESPEKRDGETVCARTKLKAYPNQEAREIETAHIGTLWMSNVFPPQSSR